MKKMYENMIISVIELSGDDILTVIHGSGDAQDYSVMDVRSFYGN